MFRFPLLIGDIGGTYCRFAVIPEEGAAPALPVIIDTSAHRSPSDALRSVLPELGAPAPRAAFLGVAGRVSSPVIRMTNAPWVWDAADIAATLGLEQVVLVNDYVPVAALLPLLPPEQPPGFAVLGRPANRSEGIRIALGPGTGLGASACIPVEGRYWLQPTEAGHVSFGACDDSDFGLWPHLERVHGRVSAETLLSGPGLVRLYRALSARQQQRTICSTPADVVTEANARPESLAGQAVRLFAALLGRYAGDLALIFGARGGVFFSGGVLPRIRGWLESGHFRREFENKAPFELLMREIPTALITVPEPAMAGLARIANSPGLFSFEHHGWSGQRRNRDIDPPGSNSN